MRRPFYCCLAFILFLSCKKENNSRVEIYILKSFNVDIVQTTNPGTISISNAVLEDVPLVTDNDIKYYEKSTSIFKLRKDVNATIKNYSSDKGFAVTVNNQVIYFGRFHPAFLSSITFGVATIDPILYQNNELQIRFATLVGNSLQLDKRNDSRIINALKATRRVK